MTVNIADMEYLGGLFDGEGYAGLVRQIQRGKYKSVRVGLVISMSDPEPIYLAARILGGKVTRVNRRPGIWKEQFNFTLSHYKAVCAAMKLFPFVRTRRRKQALLDVMNRYLSMSTNNLNRILAIVKTKSEG